MSQENLTLSVLVDHLKDPDKEIRRSAAHTLQDYALRGKGLKAKLAVPVLITTLNDENECVHFWAAYALDMIGIETK